MGKSALYQLIDICINGIMNSDREYRAIIRKSDKYSSELDKTDLSMEVRPQIERYVSEHDTL